MQYILILCLPLYFPFSQRPQVSQTITVGSSFSCSTPRSGSSSSMSMPMSGSMWTPSRVTKAGGLGRGSNPLDSFFPFDPYLLRRSHAYVAGMYNSWKVRIVACWDWGGGGGGGGAVVGEHLEGGGR